MSYSAAIPPETQLKRDTAEQYQELHFMTEKGVLYTLQKSSDMVEWDDDLSFIGGGQLAKLRLFALNPNIAPENGNDAPYETVSAEVRSVSSGGTYVSWISLEDQTIKHVHLTAIELDPSFPDHYTGLKNGYYLFLNLNPPLTTIDNDSAVTGKDLNFKNALITILTGINNDSQNGTPALHPHRGHALASKQFWRIKSDPDVDSDGDGISNTEEIRDGTNPLDGDTDNDGAPDGELLDTDQDGVPDIHDADPLDKAITWKKVAEPPYLVTDIGFPAGVNLADRWNYDLGEGGHVMISKNLSSIINPWQYSSQPKTIFETYVWSHSEWSQNLPLSDNLRGVGAFIDAAGDVHCIGRCALIGRGENEDTFEKNTHIDWKKNLGNPTWQESTAEYENNLAASFTEDHGSHFGMLEPYYKDERLLYGSTGRFVVKDVVPPTVDDFEGSASVYQVSPTLGGPLATATVLKPKPSYIRLVGEPGGWHAATWYNVDVTPTTPRYKFAKLIEPNTLISANPPTGDARSSLTALTSINTDYLPTGADDIVIWQHGIDDFQIGQRVSATSNFIWQTSTKADASQRIGGKINGRGEAIRGNKIWRNGSWKNLSEFILQDEWKNSVALDINNQGVILIQNPVTKKLALLNLVDITVVFGIGTEENVTSRKNLENYLETIKIQKIGNLWGVQGQDANGNPRPYIVEIATDEATLKKALEAAGRVVIYDGHSNFGLGPNFSKESVKTINSFTNFGVGYTDIPANFASNGGEPDWQTEFANWQVAHAAWVEQYKDWTGSEAPPGEPFVSSEALAASSRFDAEGYAFIRVQPNEIMPNPLNYIPAPLNGMRFPNDPGNPVGIGQAFTLQQINNQNFHYIRSGSRRLMVAAPNTDLPQNLRYRTFFYNACSSGPDYIQSFRHGEFVCTTRFCRVFDATRIFVRATVEGRTAAQTIPLLNVLGVANNDPTIPLNTYELQNF